HSTLVGMSAHEGPAGVRPKQEMCFRDLFRPRASDYAADRAACADHEHDAVLDLILLQHELLLGAARARVCSQAVTAWWHVLVGELTGFVRFGAIAGDRSGERDTPFDGCTRCRRHHARDRGA